jgi:hypothetical protein
VTHQQRKLKLVASNATFSFQLALNLNFTERTFNLFVHAAARPASPRVRAPGPTASKERIPRLYCSNSVNLLVQRNIRSASEIRPRTGSQPGLAIRECLALAASPAGAARAPLFIIYTLG